MTPNTITCYLNGIRNFHEYLIEKEDDAMPNPINRGYAFKLLRPLPSYPETNAALRPESQDEGMLSSGTTYNGRSAVQSRCGSANGPVPLGPLADQDNAKLLSMGISP